MKSEGAALLGTMAVGVFGSGLIAESAVYTRCTEVVAVELEMPVERLELNG